MIYSLDTSVVVDLLRGREEVRARFDERRLLGEPLVVSAIVLHEITNGLLAGTPREGEADDLDDSLTEVSIAPWSRRDAEASSRMQADLSTAGGKLTAYDALIAGQTLNRGWTLVTSDGGFERVPGLQLQNWREPA